MTFYLNFVKPTVSTTNDDAMYLVLCWTFVNASTSATNHWSQLKITCIYVVRFENHLKVLKHKFFLCTSLLPTAY